MDKLDARLLSAEAPKVLRQHAHRLRCERRIWSEIASIVEVHLSTVMSRLRRFDISSAGVRDVASGQYGKKRNAKKTGTERAWRGLFRRLLGIM